jgi:hypothetical protein
MLEKEPECAHQLGKTVPASPHQHHWVEALGEEEELPDDELPALRSPFEIPTRIPNKVPSSMVTMTWYIHNI